MGGIQSSLLGVGGVSDAGARNAAAQDALLEKAVRASNERRFSRILQNIAPLIRQMEALGAIPAFQSAGATQVSRSGLTGTGIGAAVQSAAGGAGELFALKEALGLSNDIQARQVAALLGFAGVNLAGPSSNNMRGFAVDNILQRIGSGIASRGSNVQDKGQFPQSNQQQTGGNPFAEFGGGFENIGSGSGTLSGTGGNQGFGPFGGGATGGGGFAM